MAQDDLCPARLYLRSCETFEHRAPFYFPSSLIKPESTLNSSALGGCRTPLPPEEPDSFQN
jgi:hypothetical protein